MFRCICTLCVFTRTTRASYDVSVSVSQNPVLCLNGCVDRADFLPIVFTEIGIFPKTKELPSGTLSPARDLENLATVVECNKQSDNTWRRWFLRNTRSLPTDGLWRLGFHIGSVSPHGSSGG